MRLLLLLLPPLLVGTPPLAGEGTPATPYFITTIAVEHPQEGWSTQATEDVLAHAQVKQGDIIMWPQQGERLRRMANRLWKAGYRTSLHLAPQVHGTAHFIIKVHNHLPTLRAIHWRGGNPALHTSLAKITGWHVGKPFFPGSEKQVAAALTAQLHGKGYPKAKVAIIPSIQGKAATLTIKVRTGPRYYFGTTTFAGHQGTLPPYYLRKALPYWSYGPSASYHQGDDLLSQGIAWATKASHHLATESPMATPYQEALVQASIKQLRQAYLRHGYLDIAIRPQRKYKKGQVALRFHIQAGKPYTIAQFIWRHEGAIGPQQQRKLHKAFVGKPYSALDLSQALQKHLATPIAQARTQGQRLVITPTLTAIQGHQVTLTIDLHHVPLPTLRTIRYTTKEGNSPLDRHRFRHLLQSYDIQPGAYLEEEHLTAFQQRMRPFLTTQEAIQALPAGPHEVDLVCDLRCNPQMTLGKAGLDRHALMLGIGSDNFHLGRLLRGQAPFGGMEQISLNINLSHDFGNFLQGGLPISTHPEIPHLLRFHYRNPWYTYRQGATPIVVGASLDWSLLGQTSYSALTMELGKETSTWDTQQAHQLTAGLRRQQEEGTPATTYLPLALTYQRQRKNHPFFPTTGSMYTCTLDGALDSTTLTTSTPYQKHPRDKATHAKVAVKASYLCPLPHPDTTLQLTLAGAMSTQQQPHIPFGKVTLGRESIPNPYNPFAQAHLPFRALTQPPPVRGYSQMQGWAGLTTAAEVRWRPYKDAPFYLHTFAEIATIGQGATTHQHIGLGCGLRTQLPSWFPLAPSTVIGCDIATPWYGSHQPWHWYLYVAPPWDL